MNEFTATLSRWYDANKRDLPWRETKNPYAIWISEIILQQTRVAQGLAYYERFMKRFPTVASLAQADEEEVLKLWQGLGYYSRARNLHQAARSVFGVFPEQYAQVRAMKGVGEYTAAAICSIAYDMPYAVVDGNVYRVLSRYFGVELPIDSTEGKKYFAFLADEMLDKNNPGRHNQAMMDFGALQCVPHSPDCLACPLAEGCEAFRRGCVGALPVKQHKTQVTNRFFNYIYVRMGAYTFINKRQGNDIWRNLFEFPLIETDSEVSPQEFATLPQVRELLHVDDVDVPFKLVRRGVKHVLSHRVIYTSFYEITLPEASLSFSKFKRISISEIEDYPVSRLMHAFIEKYV